MGCTSHSVENKNYSMKYAHIRNEKMNKAINLTIKNQKKKVNKLGFYLRKLEKNLKHVEELIKNLK